MFASSHQSCYYICTLGPRYSRTGLAYTQDWNRVHARNQIREIIGVGFLIRARTYGKVQCARRKCRCDLNEWISIKTLYGPVCPHLLHSILIVPPFHAAYICCCSPFMFACMHSNGARVYIGDSTYRLLLHTLCAAHFDKCEFQLFGDAAIVLLLLRPLLA